MTNICLSVRGRCNEQFPCCFTQARRLGNYEQQPKLVNEVERETYTETIDYFSAKFYNMGINWRRETTMPKFFQNFSVGAKLN